MQRIGDLPFDRRPRAARLPWLASLAALVSCTFAGCGGSAKLSGTVPAGGIVTYNGNPLEGAEVVLQPTSPNDTRQARGVTDASGKFTLSTFLGGTSSASGALPGDYKVTVQKLDTTAPAPNGTPVVASGGPPTGEVLAKMQLQQRANTQEAREGNKPLDTGPKRLTPEKYSKPNESGLTVTVPAEGKQDMKFDLVDG